MTEIDSQLNALLKALETHPALPDIALGLERVEAALAVLGNPHLRLPPVVHVAGTNGKGSTLAMLRAMLEGRGMRVHTYTSPHLVRFHERIVLAGSEVSSAQLLSVLQHVQLQCPDIPLTFFEATTLAAFLCFAKTPADVLLLEVGLGGRLDATNVIPHPVLCVMTPIALDHMEFLGGTLTKIAAEKAGIMKSGVPVVISQQVPEVMGVFEAQAKILGCPVIKASESLPENCVIPLAGEHQCINAATAIAAFLALAKVMNFSTEGYVNHLANTLWPARLQRLSANHPLAKQAVNCELWLDGGHNPSAAAVIAQWIAQRTMPCGLIIGMMQRKDIQGFLSEFQDRSMPIISVTIPDDPAAAPAEMIAQMALSAGFTCVRSCASLEEAIAWHSQNVHDATHEKHAALVICGSLYLAGKVLAYTV
jgi:dihydrofolate synthase / folylpolyglutamate synthase